ELGAAALVPVKMDRCVVKLDEKDGKKRQERLSRIACEAAKQCRRGAPMAVELPMTWKQAIARMASHDLILVPWEDADGRGIKDAHAEHPGARDIGIVIGSEGGMSPEEVAALTDAGALTVTLGPRILRTETAAVASAALAQALWGDI
ncbi:MAG: RNA methyltransferase, partial [Clostridia bacterium]|nr:RNA methyltransferase [Clostridia bacterium]